MSTNDRSEILETNALLQIGFLYVGPVLPIPQIMVASLKKSMPHARLVQMTDAATLPIPGVDEVIRKPQTDDRFMCYRLLHLRDFPRGNTVFLDVAVVVQRDLAPLFAEEFDIGLTYRDESDRSLRLSPEVRENMPFNTGVMFARASGWPFWEEAYEYSLTLPKSEQCWFGDCKSPDITVRCITTRRGMLMKVSAKNMLCTTRAISENCGCLRLAVSWRCQGDPNTKNKLCGCDHSLPTDDGRRHQ